MIKKFIIALVLVSFGLFATVSLAAAATSKGKVYVNGKKLKAAVRQSIESTYGFSIPKGKYWYDSVSGLYGKKNKGASGVLNPGMSLGKLSAKVSKGTTGIFLNGREMPTDEKVFWEGLVGSIAPGRYWLDGTTGNFGVEGQSVALGSLGGLLTQGKKSDTFRTSSKGFYSNWLTDTTMGSDGGCLYISFGDSNYSSGC